MFSELNDKQKEAVFAGDGPLLIVAGAGSGKTKTLTSRLAFLITKKGIKPEKILAITFTNKAANEMKKRVGKMIEDEGIKVSLEPFLGTFHSFGAWILRRDGKYFSRNSNFSIFDDDDSSRLIKNILKNRNVRSESKDFSGKSASAILREFSRIKSELLSKEDFISTKESEFVWDLFEEYEKKLQENNAFDFDDLIQKPVVLFQEEKDVLLKYQKMFDYILIDEYQDINTSQYVLVKTLALHHRNINAVGDDQQCIYGFRFSDFRNFLNFEKDWQGAKVVFLEQNYRSTKNIIDSSSFLISKNEFQKTKKLWTENVEGELIKAVEHSDEFSEADFIGDEARKFVSLGFNVGILFRTNAQSRALEQVFLEKSIDYDLFGALSFYERKEIKDIVAALRFVSNPNDEISFLRLEKNLGKRLSVVLREKLLKLDKDALPEKIIETFLREANYFELLKKEFQNHLERFENVAELLYFSKQFKNASDFLEKISLASPLDGERRKKKRDKNLPGISMMTIHLAKGLEFDVVFVAGVNEGILPHQRSLFSQDALEEERRLMYVAMTRAKKELFLNFYRVASRFFYDLPQDKIYFWGDKPSFNDEERWIEYD